MSKRIVIVGANAAGVDAAVAARKTNRKADITLLTKENVGAYSRCGLPFVLSGHISSFNDLVVYPSSFYRMMKLDLKLETEATNIDIDSRNVEIVSKSGKMETLEYDSLVISTGATPFHIPLEGTGLDGFLNIHTLTDGQKLVNDMKKAKTSVVIGSGLVGLETAEALVQNGIKTTVIEMLPSVLPRLLDEDMSREVKKEFEENQIEFLLGRPADAIIGTRRVKAVSVGGREIPADIVINAAGVRPNTELAQKAGLEIGKTGGIKTNIRMMTSARNIYSAGDCAETMHFLTSRPALPLLGSTAVREGKVAGTNAANGYSIFLGTMLSWVSRMFNLEVGAVGLTGFWGNLFGIDTVIGKIRGKTKAAYYPGGLSIRIKLLVERETRRVVGGQIVGGEEVTQRINALSLAIQNRMTVQELAKADTCYAPSVCETWEPIVLAAEMATRKL